MRTDSNLVFDNDELIRNYESAKKELDTSLKLYRLVIMYDIEDEIPKTYKRVIKCQSVYEELYRRRFPLGEV